MIVSDWLSFSASRIFVRAGRRSLPGSRLPVPPTLSAPPRTTDAFRTAASTTPRPASAATGTRWRRCPRATRSTPSSAPEASAATSGPSFGASWRSFSASARCSSRRRRYSSRYCACPVTCQAMILSSSVERSRLDLVRGAARRLGHLGDLAPHLRRVPAEENRQQHQRQQRRDDEHNRHDRRPRAVGTDAPDASPFCLPFCH